MGSRVIAVSLKHELKACVSLGAWLVMFHAFDKVDTWHEKNVAIANAYSEMDDENWFETLSNPILGITDED